MWDGNLVSLQEICLELYIKNKIFNSVSSLRLAIPIFPCSSILQLMTKTSNIHLSRNRVHLLRTKS